MRKKFKKYFILALPTFVCFSTSFASSSYTPFDLSYAAYRGYLKFQGIPAYGNFCRDVKAGVLTGAEIVEAGVSAGFVDPANVNEGYVHSVAGLSRGICH